MKKTIPFLLIIILLVGIMGACNINKDSKPLEGKKYSENLYTVSSMAHLKQMLSIGRESSYYFMGFRLFGQSMKATDMMAMPETGVNEATGSSDYSDTNVQVEGVDESDLVKTDGKYIYTLSRNSIISIVEVKSDGKLEKTFQINDFARNFSPTDLYVDQNFLIVLGTMYEDSTYTQYTGIYIYNKQDINNLELVKDYLIKGYLSTSRKIDQSLYIIANYYPTYDYVKDTDLLPCYIEGNQAIYQKVEDIFYFDDSSYSQYLMVATIDLEDLTKGLNLESYLGYGATVYMSLDSLYITYPEYVANKTETSNEPSLAIAPDILWGREETVIHKFQVDKDQLTHVAMTRVAGYLINQFAMDEYKGFFRLAVTTNDEFGSINNVHIFDSSLEEVGQIIGMAPGERIYSVRFEGDTGYMVTFVQVDPLFVMDLSDPYNPKVDGELKIPGYSTYLHKYSEDLLIGFGMDTDFDGRVISKGIKVAMFDVSDKTDPKQLFTISLGSTGSYSQLLYDHKAFVLDKNREIMLFPVQIVEDNYRVGSQGLAVIKIDVEANEFRLLDVLSQSNEVFDGYYVERALYIDNLLFSISDSAIYSYDFNSLDFIDSISIGQ